MTALSVSLLLLSIVTKGQQDSARLRSNQSQDKRELNIKKNEGGDTRAAKPIEEWPTKLKRWALIIGVDDYADGQIGNLRGASNDAESLAQALVQHAGFPSDQVILLASNQPSPRQPRRNTILRRLSNLRGQVPSDGLLLVAFAGHGIERAGKAFLLPSDAESDSDIALLEETAISVEAMKQRIRETSVAQVVFIIDACRNDPAPGRAVGGNPMTAGFSRSFNFDIRNRDVRAFVTLYAVAVGQRAYEYTEKKQGYFTWALVEGLKGEAADERGEVTLARLVRYIEERVPRLVRRDLGSDKRQEPYHIIEGYKAEDLVIAITERAAPTDIKSAGKMTPAPIAAIPLLAIDTSADQSAVQPGDTFTQTIQLNNRGGVAARSARIEFIFSSEFELISAVPPPIVYDRPSRAAVWNIGELKPLDSRDIIVTLRPAPVALAASTTIGRGTVSTPSITTPINFDGPSISIGRVAGVRVDAVSKGLTATPGDTLYIPFIVRNTGNYPESYELNITAPGAPKATVYSDLNGDSHHQANEPVVTQTALLDPRGRQYSVLLRVDIPRTTPDRMQFAYNLVTRAMNSAGRIASEDSTVLTVATPRVRVRGELPNSEVKPGDTLFYRLVLVNDGGGLAKNLNVTEFLPDTLEFVSSSPELSLQDMPTGGRGFVWRVAELAPGGKQVLQVTVRLRPNLPVDAVITPRHTLTYQDVNSNDYAGQAANSSDNAGKAEVPNDNIKKDSSPNRPRRLIIGSPGATAQGSRITMKADRTLVDYSAYRSGDHFYVVISTADADVMPSVKSGRGFSDMQVKKRGNDVVVSFRIQPGAKPRVEQKFNRLDVVFDVPQN